MEYLSSFGGSGRKKKCPSENIISSSIKVGLSEGFHPLIGLSISWRLSLLRYGLRLQINLLYALILCCLQRIWEERERERERERKKQKYLQIQK